MPADFNLGDNYQLDENSNGNFVVIDSTGTTVLKHVDGGGWQIATSLDVNDLLDDSTGNVVYDTSTETIGDGNQDADFGVLTVTTANVTNTDTDSVANQDYNEAVNSLTGQSGTVDVDLSVANWHEIEADGDITITFSNVSSTPAGNSLILYFSDSDGTGPHTITWPSSVEWSDGAVRDTIVADSDLEIVLRSPDGGTTWRATRSGRRFS